jgi:hypothetical protein
MSLDRMRLDLLNKWMSVDAFGLDEIGLNEIE